MRACSSFRTTAFVRPKSSAPGTVTRGARSSPAAAAIFRAAAVHAECGEGPVPAHSSAPAGVTENSGAPPPSPIAHAYAQRWVGTPRWVKLRVARYPTG